MAAMDVATEPSPLAKAWAPPVEEAEEEAVEAEEAGLVPSPVVRTKVLALAFPAVDASIFAPTGFLAQRNEQAAPVTAASPVPETVIVTSTASAVASTPPSQPTSNRYVVPMVESPVRPASPPECLEPQASDATQDTAAEVNVWEPPAPTATDKLEKEKEKVEEKVEEEISRAEGMDRAALPAPARKPMIIATYGRKHIVSKPVPLDPQLEFDRLFSMPAAAVAPTAQVAAAPPTAALAPQEIKSPEVVAEPTGTADNMQPAAPPRDEAPASEELVKGKLAETALPAVSSFSFSLPPVLARNRSARDRRLRRGQPGRGDRKRDRCRCCCTSCVWRKDIAFLVGVSHNTRSCQDTYCAVCNQTFVSHANLTKHFQSKKHAKAVAAVS
jgi:hypothetical protein